MGADTILFAIHSAIKLSQAARQAYVDSTAAAALALPLPDFNASVTSQTAINYFSTLPAATLPAGVAALIQRTRPPPVYPIPRRRCWSRSIWSSV